MSDRWLNVQHAEVRERNRQARLANEAKAAQAAEARNQRRTNEGESR